MSDGPAREVIFEITRLGDIQRVAAVDVETGTEVVIQAPAQAGLADVRALALRKLERAMSVRAGQEDQSPTAKGRGKVV